MRELLGRLRVRQKLVLLTAGLLVAVSFGFTVLGLALSRAWTEEDLEERAIAFAREIAATIGDQRELESGPLLESQIRELLAIRPYVLQVDILAFEPGGSRLVASSHAARRLPFTRRDVEHVGGGRVVSRLVQEPTDRYWELLAPVMLAGTAAGAVGVKFSVEPADRLAARIRTSALAFTAASVAVSALLVSLAVRYLVDRPIRSLTHAIARVEVGEPGRARVLSADELGLLARHFNRMMARIHEFSDELQRRVRDATAELDQRYREVQRLNVLLFETQRRLSQAERLAISGRLMAEVAHEVGTPLHSVAGHLELLRQELPPALLESSAARRLAIVEEQLARVTGIIADRLDLSRRSAGEPALVDLNRVVTETAELVSPGMSAAGLTLAVETDPGLPPVHGHASQLQQVILNLLTNAMDATPPGGRVEAWTRGAPGQAVVEVRDTGRGIPPEQQRQIFEPFFSTKEPGRGTGLGLFVSRQIVRDHQGRMEVESREGTGSRFRVTLPAAGAAA